MSNPTVSIPMDRLEQKGIQDAMKPNHLKPVADQRIPEARAPEKTVSPYLLLPKVTLAEAQARRAR